MYLVESTQRDASYAVKAFTKENFIQKEKVKRSVKFFHCYFSIINFLLLLIFIFNYRFIFILFSLLMILGRAIK